MLARPQCDRGYSVKNPIGPNEPTPTPKLTFATGIRENFELFCPDRKFSLKHLYRGNLPVSLVTVTTGLPIITLHRPDTARKQFVLDQSLPIDYMGQGHCPSTTTVCPGKLRRTVPKRRKNRLNNRMQRGVVGINRCWVIRIDDRTLTCLEIKAIKDTLIDGGIDPCDGDHHVGACCLYEMWSDVYGSCALWIRV